jgi:ComF family protein
MESLKKPVAGKMKVLMGPFQEMGAQALVPVPQSPERERERGYNPAELLAVEISMMTGIPVQRFLRKEKSTRPQMSLRREERLRNPSGAYVISGSFRSLIHVVLVDDVFTTGATLEECAGVLKKSGISRVDAVVFGRTPRHHQSA